MTAIRLIGMMSLCFLMLTLLASLPDTGKPNPLQAYAGDPDFLRPGAYSDYSGTVTPEKAYDEDDESSAQISTSQTAAPAIEYYGWSSGGPYSSLTLKVIRSASGHSDDTWRIKYSLNGGNTWWNLEGPSTNTEGNTIEEEIDALTNLAQLRVRIDTAKFRKPDNAYLEVFEIYVVGVPYVWPSLTQSGYRFFQNVDSADLSAIASNAPGTDEATAIAIDEDYMYVAGFEPGDWRIEIRDLSDGTLLDSATSDCSGQPNAIIADYPYIYVIGDDYVDGDYAWRIEKWHFLNGELMAVDAFGSGGVVRHNPSDNNDSAQAAAIFDGFLYVAGSDRSNGPSDAEWRIEQRDLNSGDLLQLRTHNPSVDDDVPLAMAIHPGGVIYLAGYDQAAVIGKNKKTVSNAEWRIEARDGDDLSLINYKTSNPTDDNDVVFALAIDSIHNALFVAGSQEVGFFDTQWRIERRSLANLMVVDFPEGTSGVIVEDFGYDDRPQSMAIDDAYLYIAGHAAPVGGGGDTGWRIEKRNLDNGELEFEIYHDPYLEDNDKARAIAVNSERMYIAGYDYPGLPGWRMEIRDISDGSSSLLMPLADAEMPANLSAGDGLRLRLLVQVEDGILPLQGLTFKLQVNGVDVAEDTPITFLNNPTPMNGVALVPSSEDPLFDSPLVRPQTYVESNSFTNSVSAVEDGYYAMWDFSLRVDNETPNGDYIIQIVTEEGPLPIQVALPVIHVE